MTSCTMSPLTVSSPPAPDSSARPLAHARFSRAPTQMHCACASAAPCWRRCILSASSIWRAHPRVATGGLAQRRCSSSSALSRCALSLPAALAASSNAPRPSASAWTRTQRSEQDPHAGISNVLAGRVWHARTLLQAFVIPRTAHQRLRAPAIPCVLFTHTVASIFCLASSAFPPGFCLHPPSRALVGPKHAAGGRGAPRSA